MGKLNSTTKVRAGRCSWRGLRRGSPLLWHCRCEAFEPGSSFDTWARCAHCGHTDHSHAWVER